MIFGGSGHNDTGNAFNIKTNTLFYEFYFEVAVENTNKSSFRKLIEQWSISISMFLNVKRIFLSYSAYSLGSKCFTSDVLVYDIGCNTWSTIQPPTSLPIEFARYGHSTVIYDESVYAWGGFNGIILNDMIRFTPPVCVNLPHKMCSSSHILGQRCEWNYVKSICTEAESVNYKCLENSLLPEPIVFCENLTSCSACVQSIQDCVWCDDQCKHVNLKCNDSKHKVNNIFL